MKILGIESSCDETAAAVVEDGSKIISNVVASQIDIHSRYGGVVPEVASRQHVLSINPVVEAAMTGAETSWSDISAVAVTNGPGLAGSLLVGVNTAKTLAWVHGLPLVGVNHMEGHIYANWLNGNEPLFPLICLIVSGGHTDLMLMREHGNYVRLGSTRDDAAGEAFDKIGRVLEVGYPGGPAIEKAAAAGNSSMYPLPRSWLKESFDFSFSGLKTATMRLFNSLETPRPVADIAAGFQDAVVDVLVTKTIDAAKKYKVGQILLAGGVAANGHLKRRMVSASPVPVLYPEPALCTDNAAMIASCGYYLLRNGKSSGWDLDVNPNLKLG